MPLNREDGEFEMAERIIAHSTDLRSVFIGTAVFVQDSALPSHLLFNITNIFIVILDSVMPDSVMPDSVMPVSSINF